MLLMPRFTPNCPKPRDRGKDGKAWSWTSVPASARTLPAPGNVLVPPKGATSPAKGSSQNGLCRATLSGTTLYPCVLSVPLPAPLAPFEHIPDKHNHSHLSLLPPQPHLSTAPSLTSPSQRIPQTHGIFKGCSNHLGDRACPELNLWISEPHLQGFSRDQQTSTESDEHPRSCLRIPTTPSEP